MRYTGAASMDEPVLGDVGRPNSSPDDRFDRTGRLPRPVPWKDKIEVRLDNRQVFFLFFGSAVVACMLFVLGVIVGKRIESRGRAAAPVVSDPLAVLDRASQPAAPAGTAPHEEVTFPSTLIGGPKGRAPKPLPVKAAPPPAAPKPVAIAPKPIAAAPKPVAIAPKPIAAAPVPLDPAKALKGKYTLQLGTLPTRDEADAFARRFSGQGAFVVAVDVPDKGTVYRVRCGNYASFTEATAAKGAFEKQNKTIALVAAR